MFKNGEFYPLTCETKGTAGDQQISVAGKARLCLNSESQEPLLSTAHLATLLSSPFMYIIFPKIFRISPFESECKCNTISKLHLRIEHMSILRLY